MTLTSALAHGVPDRVRVLFLHSVVKSYLQTDAIDPAKRRFRSSLDVVRHIYQSSGWRGFVRGIEPTLIRVRTPCP